MYAAIRKYEGVRSIDEAVLATHEQMFPLFEKQPGFVSYTLVDIGDKSTVSLTVFETQEQSEAANAAVRKLVQELLSHVIPKPANIALGKVIAHLGA